MTTTKTVSVRVSAQDAPNGKVITFELNTNNEVMIWQAGDSTCIVVTVEQLVEAAYIIRTGGIEGIDKLFDSKGKLKS